MYYLINHCIIFLNLALFNKPYYVIVLILTQMAPHTFVHVAIRRMQRPGPTGTLSSISIALVHALIESNTDLQFYPLVTILTNNTLVNSV